MVKHVQDALNQVGATTLCLDIIAPGIDLRLMLEAVKLLVGLLYKEEPDERSADSERAPVAEEQLEGGAVLVGSGAGLRLL